jgi:putative DNA primase/helicase
VSAGVPADDFPALEVYADVGGRPLADCPGCRQAGTVTRRGSDGLVLFDCFAKCGHGSRIYRDSASNGGAPEKADSTLTDFTKIVARPVEWLWRHRIALGKLTALSGPPKVGKGLLYSHLIARVTRGELDGDLDGAGDVILVTTEDEPGDTLKPRLMAAGADLARVHMFQMGTRDEPVPFRVPQDADELARRVGERQTALVVIDPLVEFIDGKVDAHKSHDVRQALAAVRRIARDHGCAIVVIFHLNKGSSTDPLLRHEGSAAFTQVIRGGLMLGRDPDEWDHAKANRRVLAVSASNLAPEAQSLVYRIETRIIDGDTGEPIETARMVATGEQSGATANDLLRPGDDGHHSERDEATEFLRVELAAGPRPAKAVKAAARDAGISEITLKRAKRELGVRSQKADFGKGWKWALPDAPHAGDHPSGSASPENDGDPLPRHPVVGRDRGPSERPEKAEGDHRHGVIPFAPKCSCQRPAEVADDGRCTRCWGSP